MATQAEGFTTVAALIPALAFHAISSAVGMQLLTAAAKRSDAEKGLVAEVSDSKVGAVS
ncbi:MAG TPA: hypothetical protein VLA05_05310 [Coriobacteriia bacterium]|nr:hypothetical protein [Coriobacteriia bacterium]